MKKTYTLKTKEVTAKAYSLVLVSEAEKKQVLKLVLAYTYEDAVAAARNWICETLGATPNQALGYIPTHYEAVSAESLLDFITEGEEKVMTDTNVLMQLILNQADIKEAKRLIVKNRHVLSASSIKYLKDELKKKDNV